MSDQNKKQGAQEPKKVKVGRLEVNLEELKKLNDEDLDQIAGGKPKCSAPTQMC